LRFVSGKTRYWISISFIIKEGASMKRIVLLVLTIMLPALLTADNFSLQPTPGGGQTTLSLRCFHPFMENETYSYNISREFAFATGYYELAVQAPLSPKWKLSASVPFAYAGVTFAYRYGQVSFTDSANSGVLGNVRVGAQYLRKINGRRASATEFGVVLPVMSGDYEDEDYKRGLASAVGIVASPFDWHNFLAGSLTLYARQEEHFFLGDRWRLALEGGPELMIQTRDSAVMDGVNVFLRYGASVGYRLAPVEFTAELAGMCYATADRDVSFADRFGHMVTFGLQLRRGTLRPGVYYSHLLSNDTEGLYSGLLGVKLDLVF